MREASEIAQEEVFDPVVRQSETPFGGWKEGGLGRELGMAGPREYLAYKRVAFDTAADFHLKTWFEGQWPRDQA